MGDVKLTPRQTAELLTKLDNSVSSVNAARAQLIDAMAARPGASRRKPARKTTRTSRKRT